MSARIEYCILIQYKLNYLYKPITIFGNVIKQPHVYDVYLSSNRPNNVCQFKNKPHDPFY
jgi:hypothetical protein